MNCVDGACEPTYNWWGNYWQLLLGENVIVIVIVILVSIKLSYCCSCYYHDHSCYHTWGCN